VFQINPLSDDNNSTVALGELPNNKLEKMKIAGFSRVLVEDSFFYL
jgi:hypothetical protein